MGGNHLGYGGLMMFVMTFLYELMSMPAMGEVTPPPLPLLPFPSHQQLVFQRREQAMFFHFGVNTFSGREQGDGTESPSIFNPEGLVGNLHASKLSIVTCSKWNGAPESHSCVSVWPSPWFVEQGLKWFASFTGVTMIFSCNETPMMFFFHGAYWLLVYHGRGRKRRFAKELERTCGQFRCLRTNESQVG